MKRERFFPILFFGIGLLGASSAVYGAVPAQTPALAGGQLVGNNTPKFAASAKDMGPATPSAVIDVTVWLNVRNRSEMDSLAKELYDPTSPNYRHWLSRIDIAARFGPTAQEAKTVQDFFTAHNLQIVSVGPDNFYVRARGTVAAVQNAFHVAINQFQVNGKTYRANTSDPYVEGAAGALVAAVYGLDNLEFKHPVARQSASFQGNGASTGVQNAAAGADSDFFSATCFTGKRTQHFSNDGTTAKYTGNGYNSSLLGCGYTPAEIQTAYNLNGLYKEGFDGTGQTIVIIDWCGSPTIRQDANAFSTRFGLPALTASNFKIIETPTPSTCAAPDAEINLDVEWAHTVAPGAAIDLVVPPSNSFQDTDEAEFYAINNQLGNVISGSYGSEELYTPGTVLITEDLINEIAAVVGISANFSSGDDGDFTAGFPGLIPASVSAPADSPYATAIGGVSLALKSNNQIAFQTGWGTNQTLLVDQGMIIDPPENLGFVFGSGGGPSGFFAKPYYQQNLAGPARQLPDISWLADPYTGVVIAITEPGVFPPLEYFAIGGTSLACPMFSALWAIANQEAGAPLGQAAPYLYSMPSGTITDILPVGSSSNVAGKVVDVNGTTTYSADILAAPLENATTFYSALWDSAYYDATLILTFGTDSGLTTTAGWDNVTGLGTPNAKPFADYFKP